MFSRALCFLGFSYRIGSVLYGSTVGYSQNRLQAKYPLQKRGWRYTIDSAKKSTVFKKRAVRRVYMLNRFFGPRTKILTAADINISVITNFFQDSEFFAPAFRGSGKGQNLVTGQAIFIIYVQ